MTALQTLLDFDARMSTAVSGWASSHLSGSAIQIVRRASQTGSYGVGWIALFAVVVGIKVGTVPALVAAATVVGTLCANTAIKKVVRRPRPESVFGHAPKSHSFPSAHSAMAVVGAAVMTQAVPDLAALWWGWAAVLAISRVVLAVHYIADVVAGLLLGAVLAALVAVPAFEWAVERS